METNKIILTAVSFMVFIPVISSPVAFAGMETEETAVAEKTVNDIIADTPDGLGLADTSKVFDLDEVIIISQPKEVMRLRQQPLSSSVFTSKEINSIGARDLSDLSGYVPSFVMPKYGSRLTSSIYIRGIGSRINNPAVGIYADGMPLVSKNSFNYHAYQLDRADILRGPQGTLYGMNTEGGLVRLYSKNPMTHQGTDVTVGMGTRLYRNAEIAHYSKLSSKLAFSVAGFYNGQNGFFKNTTTGKRADDYNEAGGKGRIVFQPTDRLSFDFIADYQYINQNAFPYGILNLSTGDVAAPATNRRNTYRRNMLNTGLNIKYNTGNLTLNSSTSYQYLKDLMAMDQDYLPQDYMHLEQRQLMNALTQEFSLKSNTEGAWQWTSGVYGSYQWLRTDAPVFFDDDFTSRISNGIQPVMYNAILKSITDRMVASGMPQSQAEAMAAATIERAGGISVGTTMDVPSLFRTPQLNIGVFHESNIRLADRLTVTLGLRYDYNLVKVDYDARAVMAVTASVMGQEATNTLSSILANSSRDNYNQLLPKVGLTYRLNSSGSNIYATVCKGYRAGGYNIQMFSDILQSELNANSSMAMSQSYDVPHTAEDYEKVNSTISYKPEESWNYEVGAHLNLFGSRLHADFAAYYMQITNQQLSVMAGDYGFGRMMVNAGKSFSCGFEAALRGNIADGRLSYALNYGLTHSEFRKYTETINGTEVDYKGKKIPFIPMHTLGARVDYRFSFMRSAVKSLVIGADFTAQGRTYWDEANTYSQPFYALLGAHADLTVSKMCFRLWCRNITDTRYNTFAFDSSASGSKVYLAQRGNPIQAGLDINFSF